ncbi:hypothetical protein FHG87_022659 [Trinorchestia longiramus]|nr:hypothetical protein FHG87_022659 [Trinorchestia longiramus]
MRQKVVNLRNKCPDGIKEWYNLIQTNNRSHEVQIHELVVNGCIVSDQRQMVKEVMTFLEDIGGMNVPLINEDWRIESEQELQMMLKIVDGYCRDFRVKLGGDKSKVMSINGDETDRDNVEYWKSKDRKN